MRKVSWASSPAFELGGTLQLDVVAVGRGAQGRGGQRRVRCASGGDERGAEYVLAAVDHEVGDRAVAARAGRGHVDGEGAVLAEHRVQVLVAREVRADDDEVQQLALLGLEVMDRVAVAVDDAEAPRGGAAGAEGRGLGRQLEAGQRGAAAVGAGHRLNHRLVALAGHHLLGRAGLGGRDLQAVLEGRRGLGGGADAGRGAAEDDESGSEGGESRSSRIEHGCSLAPSTLRFIRGTHVDRTLTSAACGLPMLEACLPPDGSSAARASSRGSTTPSQRSSAVCPARCPSWGRRGSGRAGCSPSSARARTRAGTSC